MRCLWLATDVEEVDAHEDDDEAAEQGEGVDCVGCVKALEEDGGGDDCGCCEEDVVNWVDYVCGEGVEGFVEVVLMSAATWCDLPSALGYSQLPPLRGRRC